MQQWPLELQNRALCYAVLDLIPNEGLEEALATLSDQWEFYSERSKSTPALEEPKLTNSTYKGEITRPPLLIAED